MKSSVLFDSWRQWKVCMWAGVKSLSWGLWRVLAGLVLGVVSIFAWLWRCACRFVGKHPDLSLGAFLVTVALVWLLVFVQMRVRAVGAESQRDSIAWQFQHFKESHGYDGE